MQWQVTYQWFVGGQEIPAAAGAVEMVLEATRELHDKTVSCLARNTVGQASAELRLNVKCKLQFCEAVTRTPAVRFFSLPDTDGINFN